MIGLFGGRNKTLVRARAKRASISVIINPREKTDSNSSPGCSGNPFLRERSERKKDCSGKRDHSSKEEIRFVAPKKTNQFSFSRKPYTPYKQVAAP